MKRYYKTILILCLIYSTWVNINLGYCFDIQSAAFSINTNINELDTITDTKKINDLLNNLENNWNNHNLTKVLGSYSDDFINGDGLDVESLKNLTKDLWAAYPDIECKSEGRTIRISGEYATAESTDVYRGTSLEEKNEVGSKGELKAISVGYLFLKKFGNTWKITSDKTLLEKVSIGYGAGIKLIDENKINLSGPEQVPSGMNYTVQLDLNIPEGLKSIASIGKDILSYPQVSSEDKFRLTNEKKLEKMLIANSATKNELVTATVGITGEAVNPQLIGLVILTKRVNVVPLSKASGEVSLIKTPAKSALNKTIELLDNYDQDSENFKKLEKKSKNKD